MKGSCFGGMLLVAGSCIGAGMLALPILSGLSGFFPSLIFLFLAWGFMTFTGYLLVEIQGWFPEKVNLLSMVEAFLGKRMRAVAWGCYLILFYSLLVAYLSGSGPILSLFLESIFQIHCPVSVATTLFALGFGTVIYLGTRPADLLNRALMLGLIVSYLGMIGFGVSHIRAENLLFISTNHLISSLSILVVSFGFQNMIPSLYAYFQGDSKRLRKTILGGSLMAFFVYFFWQLFVLGVLPMDGAHGILESFAKKQEATAPLTYWLKTSSLVYFAQGFAFFAIVTSFVAQGLALVHFIADGFQLPLTPSNTCKLTFLVIVPPLLFALFDPTLFFAALSFAGGFCAVILFGVLPVCMVWVGRYVQHCKAPYETPGGKSALSVTLFFSCLVFLFELIRIVGRS